MKTLKTALKIISNITTALLFMLLVITLFVVISSRASGGEPNVFGYQLKTVLSGSMEPGIKTGSIISIQPDENTTQYEKGDVITFRGQDDMIITHRILEVEENGQQYITKGDNNNGPDTQPVLAGDIIGHYTGLTIPFVGYVLDFVNSKIGALLLLVIPGIGLIGYAVITIWRTLRVLDIKDKKTVEEDL